MKKSSPIRAAFKALVASARLVVSLPTIRSCFTYARKLSLAAFDSGLKRRAAVLVGIISLSGCYDVISVDQPATTRINQAFSVTVTGGASNACPNCLPLFAITVPLAWSVNSCEYSIDSGPLLSCTADPSADTPTNDEKWRTFVGSEAIEVVDDQSVSVQWQVSANTSGDYSLNYRLGAVTVEETPDTYFGGSSAIISLSVSPAPIPALEPIHWTVLSLCLIAIVFASKTRAQRSFHQLGSICVAMLVFSLMSSSVETVAESEITAVPLSRENAINVLTSLRESENPVNLEDPKSLVTERFLLTDSNRQWLSSADEDSLRQSLEFLLSTQDLSTVSCYFDADKFVCLE